MHNRSNERCHQVGEIPLMRWLTLITTLPQVPLCNLLICRSVDHFTRCIHSSLAKWFTFSAMRAQHAKINRNFKNPNWFSLTLLSHFPIAMVGGPCLRWGVLLAGQTCARHVCASRCMVRACLTASLPAAPGVRVGVRRGGLSKQLVRGVTNCARFSVWQLIRFLSVGSLIVVGKTSTLTPVE